MLPNKARNELLNVFWISDSGIGPRTKPGCCKENKLDICKYGFHEVTFMTDSWKETVFFPELIPQGWASQFTEPLRDQLSACHSSPEGLNGAAEVDLVWPSPSSAMCPEGGPAAWNGLRLNADPDRLLSQARMIQAVHAGLCGIMCSGAHFCSSLGPLALGALLSSCSVPEHASCQARKPPPNPSGQTVTLGLAERGPGLVQAGGKGEQGEDSKLQRPLLLPRLSPYSPWPCPRPPARSSS